MKSETYKSFSFCSRCGSSLLGIFLVIIFHGFLDYLLSIILNLHLSGAILKFALLVFCYLLELLLPLVFCLSIHLFCVLSGELEIGDLHKLFTEWHNLSFEFKVGFLSLLKILLDDLEIVVHACLALVYTLDHHSSFLADSLHDSIEVFYSRHA